MSVAQVIRFDERQQMGRPRRKQEPSACVVLQFPRTSRAAAPGMSMTTDDDRTPGRGRDPG